LEPLIVGIFSGACQIFGLLQAPGILACQSAQGSGYARFGGAQHACLTSLECGNSLSVGFSALDGLCDASLRSPTSSMNRQRRGVNASEINTSKLTHKCRRCYYHKPADFADKQRQDGSLSGICSTGAVVTFHCEKLNP
jgi:hypothetical protein